MVLLLLLKKLKPHSFSLTRSLSFLFHFLIRSVFHAASPFFFFFFKKKKNSQLLHAKTLSSSHLAEQRGAMKMAEKNRALPKNPRLICSSSSKIKFETRLFSLLNSFFNDGFMICFGSGRIWYQGSSFEVILNLMDSNNERKWDDSILLKEEVDASCTIRKEVVLRRERVKEYSCNHRKTPRLEFGRPTVLNNPVLN